MEFDPGAQQPNPDEGKTPETPAVSPSVEEAFRALQEKLAKEKHGDPLDNPEIQKQAAEAIRREEQKLFEHPPKAPNDRS
jgi:hypothetical protein